MEKYLIVNLGSDSKKYALFEEGKELLCAHFEVEANRYLVSFNGTEKEISDKEFTDSAKFLFDYLISEKHIQNAGDIAGIGFRIVAPGNYFTENRIIDKDYKKRLLEAMSIAPLHLTETTKEIKNWETVAPEVKAVGISDSVFHKDLPELSRIYAISPETANKYDIYRFGYHGISVQSVLKKYNELSGGELPSRVIVCHLGSGVSITAVKDGKSFDTSMGFTPLEGLPMNSRAGNIDAGAVLRLEGEMKLSPGAMKSYLNNECGLLALGGIVKGGVRELLELEKKGNERASLALNLFAYQIKKQIGAYMAALGGVDALIFTATIGERSAIMRKRVCDGLSVLGVTLDEAKNEQTTKDSGFIEASDSPAKIAVIKTDEMKEIAEEMGKIL